MIKIQTVINEWKWTKLLHLRDKILAPSRRHNNRKRMKKRRKKKISVSIAKLYLPCLHFLLKT